MKINSITEFLQEGGASLRVYDVGRRIIRVPETEFLAMEQAQCPWPYPLQGAAWLAILHWHERRADSQSIWFLRLPLDDDGMLDQGARDNFLFMLLESLGKQPDPEQGEIHNPYAFTPRQDRMAMFHAICLRTLGLPPSSYYSHAQDYMAGKPGYDQWAFVGIQGLADLVARLQDEDNDALLAAAIPQLPDRPLEAICHCLESEAPSPRLTDALIKRTEQALGDSATDPALMGALVASLAGTRDNERVTATLTGILKSSHGRQAEVLANLSARCWHYLQFDDLRSQFLNSLVENNGGQEIFNHICIDCLRLPDLGPLLQNDFRSPDRAGSLGIALGGLFNHLSESNPS